MIIDYYIYPHPTLPDIWLYAGQGAKRDKAHRKGEKGFGRRFKRDFPGVELPQPIRFSSKVQDYIHANAFEHGLMFEFGTWGHQRDNEDAYRWGYNLTIPGSVDYKNTGHLGGVVRGRAAVESGQIQALGRVIGRRMAENGQLEKLRTPEHQQNAGRASGRAAVQSGQLDKARELPQAKEAQCRNGRIAGQRALESGQFNRIRELPQTKEAQHIVGLARGYAMVESGELARIRELPQTKEAQHRNGKIQGRRTVESGRMFQLNVLGGLKQGPINCRLPQTVAALTAARTSEHQSKAVRIHNHKQHNHFGLVENCKICNDNSPKKLAKLARRREKSQQRKVGTHE